MANTSPNIFLSQIEMTPSRGQVYDEFYWFNTNNASLSYANGSFTATGSVRFDISAYAVLGTPTIAVYLDNVLQGNVTVTSTSIAIYSLFINSVTAGTHSIKIQLSNFNSGANHVRVGLVYFTQTTQTAPFVYPAISPISLVPGQILTKEHFGSGVLRGFSLGSNGYNQTDANGGSIVAMQDMVGTGANIARCFVEIYRPNSSCEGGTSTADTYQFKTGELDKLARTITRGASLGYYVVPCIFLDPCYNTDYWGNTARKNSIISLWQQIATIYNGNATVAGYDLINEPRQNFNYAEVIRFQASIIEAIRAIDSAHVCMVECVDNDMFAMMLPLNYSNIVYSPHGYSTLLITHQGVAGESSANVRNIYPHTTNTANLNAPWGITQLSKQHDNVRVMTHRFQVPIFIGEFSCVNWSPASAGTTSGWTSTEWTNDNISLLETEGWSWVYHAWRGDYPGWESEIPSSYYNSFTFSSATPQSLPGYSTWVSNRTSAAPTITMLRGWFAKNNTSTSTMGTFYIAPSPTGNNSNNGTSPSTPWASIKSYSPGNNYLFQAGGTYYQRITAILATDVNNTVTISSYGTGARPIFNQYTKINPSTLSWSTTGTTNVYKVSLADTTKFTQFTPPSGGQGNVGFLKVDGVIWGGKKATLPELAVQWDFYSDDVFTLYVYSNGNPASKGSSIECTTQGDGIHMSSYMTLSNVQVKGVGGTAIRGTKINNSTIQNVDVTEIGGCFLGTGTNRYGDAISLYDGGTDNLIDGCSASQIYDEAYTMQSHDTTGIIPFKNITWSNCTTNNCQASFNPDIETGTPTSNGFINCLVTGCTFQNDGYGWSCNNPSQCWRPKDNEGTTILLNFWNTSSDVLGLIMENNTIINPRSGLYYMGGQAADPRFTTRNNNICIDPNVLLRKNCFQCLPVNKYPYKLNGPAGADQNAFTHDLGYETGSSWSVYNSGTCTPINPPPTPSTLWGTWGSGLYTDATSWNNLLPNINGFNFQVSWADIETSAGVFNWTYFDGQLRHALDANINIGITILTGTYAPIPGNHAATTSGQAAAWLAASPYSVHYFSNGSGPFPYYLDTNYQTRWYNLLDNIVTHLASTSYSDAERAKILFWLSAEGYNDSVNPYNGTVSVSPFNFTIDTSYSGAWDTFKRNEWVHLNGKIKGNSKTAAIRLMMNQGADNSNYQWILDNVADGWMKSGNMSYSYAVPGEKQFASRIETLSSSPVNNNRVKGQFDTTDGNSWWQTSYKQNFMAMAAGLLHGGSDVMNLSYSTAQTNTLIANPYPFTFFSKYAGIRTAASINKGFIYLKDVIDILDITRFPENVYGNIVTLNLSQFNTALNAILTNTSIPAALKDEQITSLYLTLNNTNDAYYYINPTRISNIQADFPSAAYALILNAQQRDAYNNDYSANSAPGNYSRFISQYSPDTTSIASWRTGNTSTDFFGRHGRKPNPEMFYILDSSIDTGFVNNMTFTIHYLDNGSGVWGLNAGTCKGPAEISVVKNTNTNTIKSVDITISQFSFGLLTHSSDFSIKNVSGAAPVIYMVEVVNNSKTSSLP